MAPAEEDTPLPEGVERTELDGGVRVVTESMPWVRSVALGLWVRTGSRDEHPGQAGVSHFLEHLLFKGTERYSAIEISELFDGLGASTNAATSKESTHLYARLLDVHTEEALDLLAEMLLGPTYPEVDSERQVVLEEIAMYEDEPQDRVHDVLADAVFGDHPLGRRVIGEADVIASIPVPKIAEYHAERYVGRNIVVSAAGHVDHEQVVELARKHVAAPRGAASANGAGEQAGAERAPRVCFYEKKTEQYHVCLGAPGIRRGDDRRFALGIANAVLGGSTSSRLFREVREKRGLAYAVGSYSDEYIDNGLVATYVGTREENVAEALDVIGTELASVASAGVSDEELVRAKEHIKGRMVLGLESSSARMSRIARATMYEVPLLSLDELLARVDSVDGDEVAAIAAELYDPSRFSAAAVGTDEDLFRKALEPVSPALAA
ncbi:MAG TPA: pitrilysin family protein [Solirubrobacterales bacterium]